MYHDLSYTKHGTESLTRVRRLRARRSRLANPGIDVEVDDSNARAEDADSAQADPRADSEGPSGPDVPPARGQGDAVVARAVGPRPDASPGPEEDERSVLGLGRAGNALHAYGHDVGGLPTHRRAAPRARQPSNCDSRSRLGSESVDFDESTEGHHLRWDAHGQLVGITILNARRHLERDGKITVSLPDLAVGASDLDGVLTPA